MNFFNGNTFRNRRDYRLDSILDYCEYFSGHRWSKMTRGTSSWSWKYFHKITFLFIFGYFHSKNILSDVIPYSLWHRFSRKWTRKCCWQMIFVTILGNCWQTENYIGDNSQVLMKTENHNGDNSWQWLTHWKLLCWQISGIDDKPNMRMVTIFRNCRQSESYNGDNSGEKLTNWKL